MKAILTYHSIDASGSPISVRPDVFEAHLRWLASGRVRVVSLDEIVTLPPEAGDAVALTFDDGFLSVRDSLLSLAGAGLPATVFVVTRHVGGQNRWGNRTQPGIPDLPLLDWSDLETLAARGVSMAAHTRTHPWLTTVPPAARVDELGGAREDLAHRLGAVSAHVAYPYGDVDADVQTRTREFYAWGHTTRFDMLNAADEPLLLPRLDAYYFQAPGSLESWGTRRFTRHMAWCRARRRLRAALTGRIRSPRQAASAT